MGACNELQQLRQMVDALETQFDIDWDLTNCQAAGFHSMFEAAVVKESKTDPLAYDVGTGIYQPDSVEKDVFSTV